MINYFTMRDLWLYAIENKLQDAPIRICDGMACSFYVEKSAIAKAPYTVVIDISALQLIEYDELTPADRRVSYLVSPD